MEHKLLIADNNFITRTLMRYVLLAVVGSGYSNNPVMAEHREYGFKGFIAKPYAIEELVGTIQGVIDDKTV